MRLSSFPGFLGNLRAALTNLTRRKRRRTVRHVRSYQPAIQQLEDRILLAGNLTLLGLNNPTTATIRFDDGAGHRGSVNTFLSQFHVNYTDDSGASRTFNTFCIDLFHECFVGQQYATNLRADLGAAFANGGPMAYLFDHFGLADLSANPD